jgi:hypothetical protein
MYFIRSQSTSKHYCKSYVGVFAVLCIVFRPDVNINIPLLVPLMMVLYLHLKYTKP